MDWRVWSRAGVWVDDRVISVEFVDFQGVLVSDYRSGQTLPMQIIHKPRRCDQTSSRLPIKRFIFKNIGMILGFTSPSSTGNPRGSFYNFSSFNLQ